MKDTQHNTTQHNTKLHSALYHDTILRAPLRYTTLQYTILCLCRYSIEPNHIASQYSTSLKHSSPLHNTIQHITSNYIIRHTTPHCTAQQIKIKHTTNHSSHISPERFPAFQWPVSRSHIILNITHPSN